MAKNKKSIQEKIQKEFPEFVDETNGLTIEQLNTRLLGLTKGLEVSEEAKENDLELEKAQALAAEFAAPYKDIKKAIKLKTKYVISLLNDKGAS